MKLATGEPVLTLKDVAAAVALSNTEAGISRAMRQIRHWTQSDILRTFSEKSTGRGVPRLYPVEPTIEICAILQEFARYGATVDILRAVAAELYEESDDGGWVLLHATVDEEDVRSSMQVSWDEDPETGKLINPHVNFFTVLSPGTEHAEEEGGFDPGPLSSITLNLNKVMDRVRYPDLDWSNVD
jgi:hypothetical protein